MLGFVGLDEESEEVYRLLVGLGSASVGELARKLGLPEHALTRTLSTLADLGLVAQSPVEPLHYTAAPPAVALGAALSQRRHELTLAEQAVDRLAREYRHNAVGLAVNDLIEVVIGADAVRHRFEQLQLGAEHEVLALVTDAPVAVSGHDNVAEPVAVARGVSYRVVIERGILDAPGGVPHVAAALERDEQIRVAGRVPTKLIVADRSLAMLPLRPLAAPGEPSSLVVRAGGPVEALVGLFHSVWEQSLPLWLGPADASRPEQEPTVLVDTGEQPDDVDLQVLSMLLVGMTDVSVAKQLDLGLRTVQRRVKRLMDLAEVTTRMQLGWHAYERGWVSRHRTLPRT
ncbi:helix-turn-helix domain-containing protein [Streptacidiphilus sp. N1-12]|uniref:Helix-turn-helix domain-containing protein n=2 Tax=Streptacidiphilus alkalitolerans TaxID=3342712 RepID=A0ABV6X9I3_9ACTN